MLSIRNPTKYDLVVWGIIALGICLRFRQYLLVRCLWIDECFLALNIIQRDWVGLARRLDLNQASPLGFVYTQKCSITVFGAGELSLRLFPLIAGFVAILVFAAVARKLLQPTTAAIAIALFCISDTLVYYSTESKQYVLDILVTVTLLWVSIHVRGRSMTGGMYVAAIILGAVTILSSFIGPFLLGAIGVAWLMEDVRTRKLPFTLVGGSWLVFFAVCWFSHFRHIDSSGFLHNYWDFGYSPIFPNTKDEWLWFYFAFGDMTDVFDHRVLLPFVAVLVLVGIVGFARQHRPTVVLLCLPVALCLLASALEIYPFSGRLVLFLSPVVAILIAKGIESIGGRSNKLVHLCLGSLLLTPTILFSAYSAYYGQSRCEIRTALAKVQNEVLPQDVVFFSWHASILHSYYRLAFGDYAKGAKVIHEGDPTTGLLMEHLDMHPDTNRVWVIHAETLGWRLDNEMPTDIRESDLNLNQWGVVVSNHRDRGVLLEVYERR